MNDLMVMSRINYLVAIFVAGMIGGAIGMGMQAKWGAWPRVYAECQDDLLACRNGVTRGSVTESSAIALQRTSPDLSAEPPVPVGTLECVPRKVWTETRYDVQPLEGGE